MNTKEYSDVDTLDTKNLHKFFETCFNKTMKETHTFHGGFGNYVTTPGNENEYVGLTFFNDAVFPEGGQDAIYLSKLAVCPGYQENGISKKLMAQGLEKCKEKGYCVVYLRISKTKPELGGFYEHIANAMKISESFETFEKGCEIYKIVLDEAKAKELDDSLYIEEVKKLPEDFHRKEIPFDDDST